MTSCISQLTVCMLLERDIPAKVEICLLVCCASTNLIGHNQVAIKPRAEQLRLGEANQDAARLMTAI